MTQGREELTLRKKTLLFVVISTSDKLRDLGTGLNHSLKPEFLHLYNGDNNSTHVTGFLSEECATACKAPNSARTLYVCN